MRWKWSLIVMFLVVGCGNYRPYQKPWPATIAGFKNFTSDQQQQLTQYIQTLNQMAGQTLVTLDGNSSNYPIYIQLADPPASAPDRAGYSIHDGTSCTVTLSTIIETTSYQGYIESVLDHEIGHCAGLAHTANGVMKATTEPFSNYSQQDLSTFVSSFVSSIKQNATNF